MVFPSGVPFSAVKNFNHPLKKKYVTAKYGGLSAVTKFLRKMMLVSCVFGQVLGI